MAGSLTQNIHPIRGQRLIVWEVNLAWTTDSNGAFTSTALNPTVFNLIQGTYLFKMKTIPGAASLAPVSTYAVTLVDDDGLDVLGGSGAARSRTAVEVAIPKQDTGQALYGPVLVGANNGATLTLGITGPGNSVAGTVRLSFTGSGD